MAMSATRLPSVLYTSILPRWRLPTISRPSRSRPKPTGRRLCGMKNPWGFGSSGASGGMISGSTGVNSVPVVSRVMMAPRDGMGRRNSSVCVVGRLEGLGAGPGGKISAGFVVGVVIGPGTAGWAGAEFPAVRSSRTARSVKNARPADSRHPTPKSRPRINHHIGGLRQRIGARSLQTPHFLHHKDGRRRRNQAGATQPRQNNHGSGPGRSRWYPYFFVDAPTS